MQGFEIDATTACRYLLGIQGLWPGRRWSGLEGAEKALLTLGMVQMDPMTVVARGHDLTLWSRVEDYDPAHLDRLLYLERKFFDYGGHLDVYPMSELPFWRLHMARRRGDARWKEFARAHHELIPEVLQLVRDTGPVSGRDLDGSTRVKSYRGSKDTSVSLYYLWLTGELMTHSRKGFERLCDLRERIAPAALDYQASPGDAESHFALTVLQRVGLATFSSWSNSFRYPVHRTVGRPELEATMSHLMESGEATSVSVDGHKTMYYAPTTNRHLLQQLKDGDVPESWTACSTTTDEEVIFLSPIDNLLVRDRLKRLFDFEYLWEIYKRPEKRRWGYYTMPVLYQDRLVARIDPKLDRKSSTLILNGFWSEDEAMTEDHSFVDAFSAGLRRFAQFHCAQNLDVSALQNRKLKRHLRSLSLH